MQYPLKENDVVGLANVMSTGLAANPELFPAPPMTDAAIDALTDALITAQAQAEAAKAAAEAATNAKLAALEALIEATKKDIRYAENLYPGQNDRLRIIGWGARKEPTPTPVPGEVQNLTANPQGEGWVLLEWQKPLEGGKPSAYKIMRRKRSAGGWENIGTATQCGINLTNQERGIEWEYCIVATNKAGDSPESNVVMAVL
jgi:hypothetical protein